MFVDELSTKDSLVRMVRRMTANLALREDLLQEALIHLWLTEARRPGQTKSWYLQSCKYHLLHYLASGRSIDSGKRRAGQLLPNHDADHSDGFPEEMDSGNSVFTCVSARDIISLLSPQLLPQEKAVLNCFADGLGPREIGRKLKMSHTMVIKHRRKIASLFNRLDLPLRQQLPRSKVAVRHALNGFQKQPLISSRFPFAVNGHPNKGHSNRISNGYAHSAPTVRTTNGNGHARLGTTNDPHSSRHGNGHNGRSSLNGHQLSSSNGHSKSNGHSVKPNGHA